jgi:ketosteroid isomerase-like protein
MKYLAIRLIVALSTFVIGLSAVSMFAPFRFFDTFSKGEAEQEVMQVERAYIQAHLHRDTATLDNILADEFTISGRGRFTTKAQRLALLENPDFVFEAIATDNVRVYVNGESALVTGVASIKSRYGDEESVSPVYGYVRRYEKRDGRWQIISVEVRRAPR